MPKLFILSLFYVLLSYNSFAATDLSCPGLLSENSVSAELLIEISQKASEMIDTTLARELGFGVATNDLTEFYVHKKDDSFIKTKTSVVIYHGLYNSPAYTRWMAQILYQMGFNVINAKLPKHNHKRRRDLNKLTPEDMMSHATETTTLAEELGDEVVYIGHSAGGTSAIYSGMSSIKTKGLVLYSPALELTDKSRRSAYIAGRTFITNVGINAISKYKGETRYISAAAGRTTAQFANILKNTHAFGSDSKEPYGLMIQRLSSISSNILWIDTENDATVKDSVNEDVAKQIPGVSYFLLPKELNIAHVALASPAEDMETPEAKTEMEKMTQELINFMKKFL